MPKTMMGVQRLNPAATVDGTMGNQNKDREKWQQSCNIITAAF